MYTKKVISIKKVCLYPLTNWEIFNKENDNNLNDLANRNCFVVCCAVVWCVAHKSFAYGTCWIVHLKLKNINQNKSACTFRRQREQCILLTLYERKAVSERERMNVSERGSNSLLSENEQTIPSKRMEWWANNRTFAFKQREQTQNENENDSKN